MALLKWKFLSDKSLHIIYEDDKEAYPDVYQKATHIAVIGGWGYHLVAQKNIKKNQFSVIPIKK